MCKEKKEELGEGRGGREKVREGGWEEGLGERAKEGEEGTRRDR